MLTVGDAADNNGTDTIIVIVKADSSFPMWIVSIGVAAGIIAVAGLFIWKRKEVDKQRLDQRANINYPNEYPEVYAHFR